jgi:hypothetical protein
MIRTHPPCPLLLQREGGADQLIKHKFDNDSPLVILSGVEGKRGVRGEFFESSLYVF